MVSSLGINRWNLDCPASLSYVTTEAGKLFCTCICHLYHLQSQKPFRAHLGCPWERLGWVVNPNSLPGLLTWQRVCLARWWRETRTGSIPSVHIPVNFPEANTSDVSSKHRSVQDDRWSGFFVCFGRRGGRVMKVEFGFPFFFFKWTRIRGKLQGHKTSLSQELTAETGFDMGKVFSMLTKCRVMGVWSTDWIDKRNLGHPAVMKTSCCAEQRQLICYRAWWGWASGSARNCQGLWGCKSWCSLILPPTGWVIWVNLGLIFRHLEWG